MKKIVLVLVTLLIAAGAAMTCPDQKAHKSALMATANTYVDDKVDSSVGTKGIAGAIGQGLKAVKKAVGAPAASLLLDKYLEVDNYGILSVGKIVKKGDSKTVSLGIFGHVFTPSTEMIDKALNDKSDN